MDNTRSLSHKHLHTTHAERTREHRHHNTCSAHDHVLNRIRRGNAVFDTTTATDSQNAHVCKRWMRKQNNKHINTLSSAESGPSSARSGKMEKITSFHRLFYVLVRLHNACGIHSVVLYYVIPHDDAHNFLCLPMTGWPVETSDAGSTNTNCHSVVTNDATTHTTHATSCAIRDAKRFFIFNVVIAVIFFLCGFCTCQNICKPKNKAEDSFYSLLWYSGRHYRTF